MEKCQRCLKNNISLKCLNCPSINKICSLCDKKIHNLTSKINHNRMPIENITINLKDNIPFENKIEPNEQQISNNNDIIFIENNQQDSESLKNNNNMNYNIKNISEIVKNNNSSIIMDNINLNNNTYDISTLNQSKDLNENIPKKYNKTTYYLNNNQSKSSNDIHHHDSKDNYFNSNNNDNENYIKNNNLNINNSKEINNNNTQRNLNSVFNKKLLIADNYSKDYINEIKKIFKKEKDELEYKNKALEMSINRLKIEFNEQIAYLTKELDNNQSNNILNIKAIKENYKNTIDQIKKNNEIEVCSLKEEIYNYENDKK